MNSDAIAVIFMIPLGGLLLLYLLALRPWRPLRALRSFSPGPDLLVSFALMAGAAAVWLPEPFDEGAVALVARTDLPSEMAAFDHRIYELETMPERYWRAWVERLGFGDYEKEVLAPPPAPGPVAATILPGVEELVSALLRLLAYGMSIVAAAMALMLRFWMLTTAWWSEGRRSRWRALDERLARVEATLDEAAGLTCSTGDVSELAATPRAPED